MEKTNGKETNRLNFWKGYFYTQIQTIIHKFWVAVYMLKYYTNLSPQIIKYKGEFFPPTITLAETIKRIIFHDISKFTWIEAKGFAETIFDLKKTTYGTPEYKALLDKIKPCLDHHYKNNSHHPEYHGNKVQNMSRTDIIEMICDWKAAVRRHADGDIKESFKKNEKRWNIPLETMRIMIEVLIYIEK